MPEFFLTALANLGNTCFMNSAIQALYATQEFKTYLLNGQQSEQKLHKSLAKLFQDMISCGESEDDDCVSPHEFREVFIKEKTDFDNHNQHDCQEFLSLLIDCIHEETNKAKDRQRPEDLIEAKTAREAWNHYKTYTDDSFLVSIFVGQTLSTITYADCNHKRRVWESFWSLSLCLPSGDEWVRVKDCLKSYLADETMDGELTCGECQTKRKTIRSTEIERLPLILTINLKRFDNDGKKISRGIFVDQDLYVNQIPYTLYACICHRGESTSGGHYYVFCRYTSENWYHFDDSDLNQYQSYREIQSGLTDAYILFYHMTDVTLEP